MMISLFETLSWYEQNAQVFESRTATVDMTRIYDLFLPYVVQGGNILDAGCGVGRDALAFAERGYQVTAIDGSLEMVKRTRLRTANHSVSVYQMLFSGIAWHNQFDGFWCCASLLHLAQEEQKEAYNKLAQALKPSGIGYVSFKLGAGIRLDNGRYFYDMDEERLRYILEGTPLNLRSCIITQDQSPEREVVKWVNTVLEAKNS
ncbi:bifunctional 2-polyprenyl-6-hydroxyphenol methylase/3-demethylubiquinol 3-O-methyltransferase UbiG [Acetobacter sp. DsW_059]|uniref:class I SAM-dependent methyltransferase n=1 Tax=Acetobacter sp. DsW_059 TaxID=1670661 RepID=UPI000A3CC36F|nr:class I SAM-dependent methyltransferase [Acetobacter sp. DsW_059]OUJ11263.1 hypothetical protein HK25_01925 [Acetobacter sp. DsW_059]